VPSAQTTAANPCHARGTPTSKPRSIVHVGEPAGVLLVLTLRGGEEGTLQFLRDPPPVTLADDAVVDLADRCELRGRAREEALIGVVQVGPDQVLLAHLVPE